MVALINSVFNSNLWMYRISDLNCGRILDKNDG